MAGIRGNIAWLLAAKQASKGVVPTPDTTNAYKFPFVGGNIAPVRETDRLSETDATRDQGISYVVTSGVEGEPEVYVRDEGAPFWLHAGLGAVATSGAGPNYTHVITPSNNLPYIALWRNIGDTLYEQFQDCKVGSVTISAEAGQPLTLTAGIQGLQATRLTAVPDAADPVPVQNGAVYSFNEATVTLGGGPTALVRSFELGIENNLERQQTDNVVPYDVWEGQREVSLSFDMLFETLDEYNKFHYGGAAGTSISNTIFTTSAVFSFAKGANNEISFNLPSIAYEEFPVEPSAAGDPVVVSVRAVGQRGPSPIVTATVKNQVSAF